MTSADRLTLTAWTTVTAAGLALTVWAGWRVLAWWAVPVDAFGGVITDG